MSPITTPTVLPIQRLMAHATPRAWRDGIVVVVEGAAAAIAFLDGSVGLLHAPAADLVPGEPVAYHPVSEILAAGGRWTTARA